MKTTIKLLSLSLLCFMVSLSTLAQRPGPMPGASPEAIQKMKKEFLTDRLGLNEEEAESFWEIYSQFDEDRDKLRETYKGPGNPLLLNDDEAEEQLANIFEFEEKMLDMKRKYFEKFESVLNTRQLLYMHQLESEFRRELITRVRKRMAARRGDQSMPRKNK